MSIRPKIGQDTDVPSRRDCLKLGLLVGAGGIIAGCSMVGQRVSQLDAKHYSPTVPTTEEERVLNRLGFGPNAASLAEYRSLGGEAFIERELRGDREEDPGLLMQLQRLDVLQLAPSDLWDIPYDVVLAQLQQAAILRAHYGKNQLRERMADFWSNHFNIYARKGNTGYSKGTEETEVVRKHALGNFPEMLAAMAHSPCMLEFLDNEYNRKGIANENYARELMELHTLGLHGGYTQKDVQEVARCFTGWTIENRFLRPKGRFRFDGDSHDDGQKTVLGHIISSCGGEEDGNEVLKIVSQHPSTARFLSTKLSRYFLGREDNTMIGSMSEVYLRTGGDIPSMLGPLISTKALMDSGPILKRPFDYMISALRVTESEADGGLGLQSHLERMGEPLYQWPMPDGYPVKTASWTSSLLPRWNFAIALTHGQVPGASCNKEALALLAAGESASGTSSLISPSPPPGTNHRTVGGGNYGGPFSAALCLASPEFQWR